MDKQSNIPLMISADLEEGLLPDTLCIMYLHKKETRWGTEMKEGMFGSMGDPVPVFKQFVYKDEYIRLATFDEKSLIKHIETYGTKIEEKPSHVKPGDKDVIEYWLSYEKLPFKQLNGVKMFCNEDDTYWQYLLTKQERKHGT